MKQYFGMSQTGNLKEAAQGVHAPGLLILMSNADQFEAHVTELESLFPGVPSIGCIGMSYSTRIVERESVWLLFMTMSPLLPTFWSRHPPCRSNTSNAWNRI